MLKLELRCVALLLALTMLAAAQCVSTCAVSGCHHSSDSMDSMHASDHTMSTSDSVQGHHSHEDSAPTEPMQHDDEDCGSGSCGGHASYFVKADGASIVDKLVSATVSPALVLCSLIVQNEVTPGLLAHAAHLPPHLPDISALSTVLRI